MSASVARRSAVLFIHGLWLHASAWRPWIDLFAAYGYAAIAPGWPGDMSTVAETRRHPEALAGVEFDDLVAHYAAAVDGDATSSVVVGHAFGGSVALRLMSLGIAGAGIEIGAATGPQPAFVAGDQDLAVSELDEDGFAAYYGSAITRRESDQLHAAWSVPAARTVIAGGTTAAPAAALRGPFLSILGGPPVGASVGLHRPGGADLHHFPDRGRSLVIDSGWREVAESCLAWLDAQEL